MGLQLRVEPQAKCETGAVCEAECEPEAVCVCVCERERERVCEGEGWD